MPTYEYACRDCGEHLEVVQSFKDDSLTTCPSCAGNLRKVFSAAGIIFKGSGWHVKDYAASNRSGGSSSDSSDGAKDAAGSGKDDGPSKGSDGSTGSAAKGSDTKGSDASKGSDTSGGTKDTTNPSGSSASSSSGSGEQKKSA
ncbi:MAG: zinc ribbon domain-containing protein [Nitriliruptor sp.]|nr:MAG: zinc ribbon domain-containing protein [Nitriliruptor sp.]